MKFCQPHWDKLKAAVTERGMWPLVARSGAEGVARMAEEIQGTATDATYDPLMACHWMIAGRALDCLGLYVMGGDLCPLCEVLRVHDSKPCEHGCTHDDVEERWINGPADAALRHVRESPVLVAMLGKTP